MGMDVFGLHPTAKVGVYFRASWWQWRPLAEYFQAIAPGICQYCRVWLHNDGDGLKANRASALADVLDAELVSGRCQQYAAERETRLSTLPPIVCQFCDGSGKAGSGHARVRIWELSETEINEVNPDDVLASCPMCGGQGCVKPDVFTFYVELVREFAAFLHSCGGFSIR
jgi:hypothetical protein